MKGVSKLDRTDKREFEKLLYNPLFIKNQAHLFGVLIQQIFNTQKGVQRGILVRKRAAAPNNAVE